MAEIRLVKTSAHKIESSEEQRLKLGDIVKEGGDTQSIRAATKNRSHGQHRKPNPISALPSGSPTTQQSTDPTRSVSNSSLLRHSSDSPSLLLPEQPSAAPLRRTAPTRGGL